MAHPVYDSRMEPSDWIAGAALLISILAAGISIRALKHADRQASAAERANQLAAGPQWRVLDDTGTTYKLYNISQFAATQVEIDASRIGCFATDLPDKATIGVGSDRRQDGYRFTMMGGDGQPPVPSAIYVRWAEGPTTKDGKPQWTAVTVEHSPKPFVHYR